MRPTKGRIDADGRECSLCGAYKPWDKYQLSRNTKTGHSTRCRKCLSKQSLCRVTLTGRECARCHEHKPWREYGRKSRGTRGYASRCRECVKETK